MANGNRVDAAVRVRRLRSHSYEPSVGFGSAAIVDSAAVVAASAAIVVLMSDDLVAAGVITLVLAGLTLVGVVARWLLVNQSPATTEGRAEEDASPIVTGLVAAVEARDRSVQDHEDRVGAYARAIAAWLSLPEERMGRLELAARFHDIGKLAVPESILGKSGSLTPEEHELVKAHCVAGERILLQAGLSEMAAWVRSHQEHWNGGGYPDGLAGESIPLESRILAGADALDAMTSDRPYRRAMTPGQARAEVVTCSGTQFDPRVAEAMVAIIDSGLVTPPALYPAAAHRRGGSLALPT